MVTHGTAMEWMSYPHFYALYSVYWRADHDAVNNEWPNLVTHLPATRKRVGKNGLLEIAVVRARWVE